ncbi:MAG: malonic semialdehyde reductase [Sphingopyxis macrogoltabida]|uniref:Malonic semialdehyde reductase n=1 Tax=Sphingopyxis macrogoltabida TaxID=33050 RepID=A0A2W5L7J7_SPHMC|nr:MAG: malonic semialdehyde reductase [Sphingopyxis macrogoltabida]
MNTQNAIQPDVAAIDQSALDQLFHTARTYSAFEATGLSREDMQSIYDSARWGPTSSNCNPARFIFLQSDAEKERLVACVSPLNVDKVRSAPCCVIVARDTQFFDNMKDLFPARDLRPMFADNPALAADTMVRNTTLQGGYFILAARALGFDCGPMSGFDAQMVNAEFFPDGRYQADFLINIGRGDKDKLWPRNPRLAFDQACEIR